MQDSDSEGEGRSTRDLDPKRNLVRESMVRPFIEPKPHALSEDERWKRGKGVEESTKNVHPNPRPVGYVHLERGSLEVTLYTDRRVPLGIRETWTIRDGDNIVEITRSAEGIPRVAYKTLGELQAESDVLHESEPVERQELLFPDDRKSKGRSRSDGTNPDHVILDEYQDYKGEEENGTDEKGK